MIAEETVERVRREARIAEIVGERLRLERKGRALVGLCPFHKEKTPSFNVNDERGFYHCFGCSASGDAIRFIRELDGLSFIDAVRQIAERQGIEIVETGSDEERRQASEVRRRREELFRVGEIAASFFQQMLKRHPLRGHALKELARRGLDGDATEGLVAETLAAFRVGYAPYGWDGLSTHLNAAGIGPQAAERVGLLVPRKNGSGYYDRFRHRLMFAVLDMEGRIIAFSGRALDEPADDELKRSGVERMGSDEPAKYLNSPESPIYKKREAVFGLHQARRAARDANSVLLVEGNFDVVSLHARGIGNVVAPLGTAFTAEQAKQLRRVTPNVVLLFDGDEAGRRAIQHAREPCSTEGLAARVAVLPEGVDPDDLVRQRGPEAIQRLVSGAKSLLEHLIDVTLDRGFTADDARSQVEKIKQVGALISAEDDPTVRAFAERHADAIAARLDVGDARTFRALSNAVKSAVSEQSGAAARPRGAAAEPQPPERARSRDRRADIGFDVFGALVEYPSLLEDPEVLGAIEHVQGRAAAAIAAMRQIAPGAAEKNPELLLAKLSGPIHPFAAARVAAPRHERVEDARAELLRNAEKLKHLEHSRQRSEVLDELERMRACGDFESEMLLLQTQARRARERHGL